MRRRARTKSWTGKLERNREKEDSYVTKHEQAGERPRLNAPLARRLGFPARRAKREKYAKEVQKTKAQEIARYVLPVATCAYLYHTVSALTLLRYWRMCLQYDPPYEQRLVVGKMVGSLLEVDPEYRRLLEEPIPTEQTPEARFFAERPDLTTSGVRAAFVRDFDASIEGKVSKLVDWKGRGEEETARAVREVLGVPTSAISDDEAIALAVSPARNAGNPSTPPQRHQRGPDRALCPVSHPA